MQLVEKAGDNESLGRSLGGSVPDIPIPEWIDTQSKPIVGLDLLGLRMPVQVINTSLINGVTTISPRIRHLSIRPWIIKMFSESGLPNEYSAVADFANRVEYSIALGILFNKRETVNIPGITNALELIDGDEDPIPVQKLVSQTVFTAYAGPTYDLVLSYAGETGIPGLFEERGMVLAQAFENLTKDTRFQLFSAVNALPSNNRKA